MSSPWEDGDPNSKICFIGEAPSTVEMREGRPLVGPSGHIFEQCLHSAQIVRRASYIVNVWPFPVKKSAKKDIIYNPNDDAVLWTSKGGITKEGLEDASDTIKRLAACKANVFVPMGNPALSLLYGENSITRWRGSILSAKHEAVRGRKVIPTVHPASSIHGEFTNRYLIQKDLQRVREESKTPKVNLPKRNLIINPAHSEVMDFLNSAAGHEQIATDIECLNNQVSCFSVATSPLECMSIPLLDEYNRSRWTLEEEIMIWLAYARIMGDPEIMKINQNIIFDIVFLLQQNKIWTRGQLGDTMIAMSVMYPEFKKDLGTICSIFAREPYYKDDKKLWKNPDKDPERFWLYNARDSVVAFEAWIELEDEMEKTGFRHTYDMTIEDFPALLYMMTRGLLVDRERLAKTAEDVRTRIYERQAELDALCGRPLNVSSPKQCQQYFYVEKGIKPYISRSTGSITTDDKAMARIHRRFKLREAKLVQDIRADRKLLSTYLEVVIDPDGWLRCFYNPRGTWTGRISSSQTVRGTGMNLANLHPDFKDFIVAELANHD